MMTMEFNRSHRLPFIFFLLAFFVFASAGASGRPRDSKTKDDAGWELSDSSGDDGFGEGDNGDETHSNFKEDSDDTYEDDKDSSEDQVNSMFKDDGDQDDQDTDQDNGPAEENP